MTQTQKLRKLGGSVATIIPKPMLDRLRLEAGDEIFLVETEDGLLLTPLDPDFADALAVYERSAKKYPNALRRLAQ
ncbi:MAG: AbrB/MazE/SpoVT family DNA-binding domain-containing protein [Bacteroidota bacterium]